MPRKVKWIDFTAPFFHVDFVREFLPIFPEELNYGWGLENLAGMMCKKKGWEIIVMDNLPVVHLVSQTIRTNKMNDYCQIAEKNMDAFFEKDDKMFDEFLKQREYGFNYKL